MVRKACTYPCRITVEVIILRRNGGGVFAGTHSATYSCTVPSLIISSTPWDSKCYRKTHPEKVWFQNFRQLCPQVLECPTTNNQGSRFLCNAPQTSKLSLFFLIDFLFQWILDSLCPVTFLCPPTTVSMFLFSFSVGKNNILQGTNHSSQWNQSL